MYSDFLKLDQNEIAERLTSILKNDQEIISLVKEAKAWDASNNPDGLDVNGQPYSEKALIMVNLFNSLDTVENLQMIKKVNKLTQIDLVKHAIFAKIATDKSR